MSQIIYDHDQARLRLLGSLLSCPDESWRMAPTIEAEAFGGGIARASYEWLMRRGANRTGATVEPDELIDGLVAAGHPSEQAQQFVLQELWPEKAPVSLLHARAEDYRRVVYGNQLAIALREAAEAARGAVDCGRPYAEVRDEALRRLAQGSRSIHAVQSCTVAAANEEAMRLMQQAREAEGCIGLTLGIPGIDDAIGGFRPAQLTVVAARMKIGKTHVAVHVAERAATTCWPHLGGRQASVLFLSMEMAAGEMRHRAFAWHSGVPSDQIARGSLGPEQWDRVEEARADTDGLNLRYVTERGLTIEGVCDVCRSHAAQGPLDLIVVDYLDLVRRPRSQRDDLEVGRVVRGLLEIAGELDAHVLLLAQLNREGTGKPKLHHLAGSDEVARAAHNILLLERLTTSDDVFGDTLPVVGDSTTHDFKFHVTSRAKGADDPIPVRLDYATSRISAGNFSTGARTNGRAQASRLSILGGTA